MLPSTQLDSVIYRGYIMLRRGKSSRVVIRFYIYQSLERTLTVVSVLAKPVLTDKTENKSEIGV